MLSICTAWAGSWGAVHLQGWKVVELLHCVTTHLLRSLPTNIYTCSCLGLSVTFSKASFVLVVAVDFQ